MTSEGDEAEFASFEEAKAALHREFSTGGHGVVLHQTHKSNVAGGRTLGSTYRCRQGRVANSGGVDSGAASSVVVGHLRPDSRPSENAAPDIRRLVLRGAQKQEAARQRQAARRDGAVGQAAPAAAAAAASTGAPAQSAAAGVPAVTAAFARLRSAEVAESHALSCPLAVRIIWSTDRCAYLLRRTSWGHNEKCVASARAGRARTALDPEVMGWLESIAHLTDGTPTKIMAVVTAAFSVALGLPYMHGQTFSSTDLPPLPKELMGSGTPIKDLDARYQVRLVDARNARETVLRGRRLEATSVAAVARFVEENRASVLHYQPQVLGSDGRTVVNHFELVLQTPAQRAFLVSADTRVGGDACLDGMLGVSANYLHVHTLVVGDVDGRGVPVAHLVSQLRTAATLGRFVTSVAEGNPVFAPRVIVTDMDGAEGSMIETVAPGLFRGRLGGHNVRHRFCWFHVVQALRRHMTGRALSPYLAPVMSRFERLRDAETDGDAMIAATVFLQSVWAVCHAAVPDDVAAAAGGRAGRGPLRVPRGRLSHAAPPEARSADQSTCTHEPKRQRRGAPALREQPRRSCAGTGSAPHGPRPADQFPVLSEETQFSLVDDDGRVHHSRKLGSLELRVLPLAAWPQRARQLASFCYRMLEVDRKWRRSPHLWLPSPQLLIFWTNNPVELWHLVFKDTHAGGRQLRRADCLILLLVRSCVYHVDKAGVVGERRGGANELARNAHAVNSLSVVFARAQERVARAQQRAAVDGVAAPRLRVQVNGDMSAHAVSVGGDLLVEVSVFLEGLVGRAGRERRPVLAYTTSRLAAATAAARESAAGAEYCVPALETRSAVTELSCVGCSQPTSAMLCKHLAELAIMANLSLPGMKDASLSRTDCCDLPAAIGGNAGASGLGRGLSGGAAAAGSAVAAAPGAPRPAGGASAASAPLRASSAAASGAAGQLAPAADPMLEEIIESAFENASVAQRGIGVVDDLDPVPRDQPGVMAVGGPVLATRAREEAVVRAALAATVSSISEARQQLGAVGRLALLNAVMRHCGQVLRTDLAAARRNAGAAVDAGPRRTNSQRAGGAAGAVNDSQQDLLEAGSRIRRRERLEADETERQATQQWASVGDGDFMESLEQAISGRDRCRGDMMD